MIVIVGCGVPMPSLKRQLLRMESTVQFRNPIILFALACTLVSSPLQSAPMAQVSIAIAETDQAFRSRILAPDFHDEVCRGTGHGRAGVARLIVVGQQKILLNQEPHSVIVEIFDAGGKVGSTETLAATIAAQALASMVRQEQIGKPLSLGAAEVLCLAVLMNYDSYLRKHPEAHPTELEFVTAAGSVFDEMFKLVRRGEFLAKAEARSTRLLSR